MRSVIKTGMFVLMLAAMPIAAQAGTLEGVAIGAGTGAVIAGASPAVVGAVIGGVVGGLNVVGAPPSPLLDHSQWISSLFMALSAQ